MKLMKLIKRFIFRLRGTQTIDELIEKGLKVGKNFSAQHGYDLDVSHCWLIQIGDDVTLAPNVQILAHDASTCKHLGYAKIGRVNIGSRVFVGAGSIILPGVTIGRNTIIGAGSVVTRDVPDNCVYAGNPARYICSIEDFTEKHRENMEHRPVYSSRYTLRENISPALKQQQYEELADGIGYVE